MFQNLDSTVTNFMLDYDITIIEFLDSIVPKYLDSNDITVTKFLDAVVDNFLQSNDITVTKFMDEIVDENDLAVTKFLADTTVTGFHWSSAPSNYGRANPAGQPRNWRSYR